MIRNIVITTIRNFIRQPFFAGINVLGLAIGIASSLLIMIYVWHESSYDNFHPEANRLYRVNQTNIWNPNGGQMSSTVIPLASALLDEFPEIESTLRINAPGEQLVRYGEEAGYEKNILAADSNFFSFFGFKLLEGNPETALNGKNKVVITEEIRNKFFKDEQALGKVFLFGDAQIPVEVTGVVATPPTNTHFDFDYLWSLPTNPVIKEFDWSWFMSPLVTYVKLKPATSAIHLEEKFKSIAPKYIPPTFDRFNMDYEEFVVDIGGWNFYLQPVKDIHLHSATIGNRIGPVSDIHYIYIFSVVAVFILVLGCINFINLSTARASSRAKEVGIRKVLGSFKKQLIAQYILESVILCFVATVIGIAFMEIIRIFLQDILTIRFAYSWDQLWPIVFIFPLVLGILAGIYPAFYLTAFNPAKVLKGNLRSGLKSAGFRNSLVVVQFSVAIVLIVCTVIVQQQLSFLNSKNLGYDREQIIVINHADRLKGQLQSFRNILKKENEVISASIAMNVPGRGTNEDMFTKFGDDKQISINQMKIDPDFFKTMELELLSGRIFQENAPADYNKVILNESAISWFGWDAETALGKHLNYPGDDIGKLEVIGVVKNFHFQSLREPVNPLIFMHHQSTMWGDSRVLAIRYKKGKASDIIKKVENEWSNLSDEPLSYSFLDAEYQSIYFSEKQLGHLFSIFSLLTMVIAVIGLFGLSVYTLEQRAKEISIRKIFGAGSRQLCVLISKEYAILILISFAIAVPVSLISMNKWLENYVYHINPNHLPFMIAALLVIVIVAVSSGFKIVQAASSNPVDALNNE